MAILALGVLGASLTSAVGIGASVGWLGGVIVGNLLFGQKGGPTQEGSRLSDLSVQSSTYGSALPLVYGTMRFAGNVIWSTPLQETRHVQTQHGGKGGGGGSSTQVTYTYSVSFAVGLCVGPVSTIRRIWADTKLIYDATASNTQSVEKYPGVIRFYVGDEDQLPDPTMEMYLGAGQVPAHRGLVYIVFTNLQLADFANRIPNIGAEVVATGGLQCNAVILPSPSGGLNREGGVINAANGIMIGTNSSSNIYKYDLINNQLLMTAPMTDAAYGSLQGIDSQGYYYHCIDIIHVGMKIVKRHPETLGIVAQTAAVNLTVNGAVRRDKVFAYMSRLVYNTSLEQIADLSTPFPSYGSNTAPMCDDPFGNYWQAAKDYIRKYDSNGNLTSWSVSAWTGGLTAPDMVFWDDTTGHIYFTLSLSDRIVKWNVNSGFVAYLDGCSLAAGFGQQALFNMPLNGKWWTCGGITATKIDLASMTIMETADFSPFLPTTSTHFGGVYEKFTNSIVVVTDAGEIKYPLDRYGNDTVPLAGVLTDLCLKAGMKNTDVISSAVTNNLRGYIVNNRMAARDALQPLLGTFFIDGVEIDGVLNFVPRGQASAATIPYNDLGASDNVNPGDEVVRMDETRKQTSELPLRIDLTHIDPDRSYLTNTQHAARIAQAVGTEDLETIQLSIALTSAEAAQVVQRTLKNAWIERNSYTFNLGPSHLRLDPTDVITVLTDVTSFLVRLNQVDFGANNVVACTAIAEDGYAYISNATGTAATLQALRIVLNGPVSLFLLDTPMLALSDDSVGLYYAFGLRNGVTSAALYKAPDQLAWRIVGTGVEGPAFGWATTVLGDYSRPWVWDYTNTVTVVLGEGTLDSKTALDVLNWNNVAMLGDEIIQWQTATLVSDNTYTLSGLLRGRRGTEDATGSHAVGEQFVVLSTDGGLYRAPMGSTEIGNTAYYKGVAAGGIFDDAPTVPFTFEGRSLRCFAPVRVRGSRDGSNNLSLTWIRRTRWYGEWADNTDVPLFEDSEAYQIDVLSGGVVKRTISTASQAASYTAAQQISDFGATQTAVSVAVYQINAVIGRGEPAYATI